MKINQTLLLMMALLGCVLSQFMTCKQSADLIVNGGFEQNQCKDEVCGWYKSNYDPNSLPGWEPQPEIELGKAYIYNSYFINSWIVELAYYLPTCIVQKFSNLKSGNYTLEFDWAARMNIRLDSNTFKVLIGGNEISNPQVSDLNVHHEIVQFSLTFQQPQISLKFCGTGPGGAGALIDNVKLRYRTCKYY